MRNAILFESHEVGKTKYFFLSPVLFSLFVEFVVHFQQVTHLLWCCPACDPTRQHSEMSPQPCLPMSLFICFIGLLLLFLLFLKQVLIIYSKVTRNLLCRPGWSWTCDNCYASASTPLTLVRAAGLHSHCHQALYTFTLLLAHFRLCQFFSLYFKIAFILCVWSVCPGVCLCVYHTHKASAEAKLGHQVP